MGFAIAFIGFIWSITHTSAAVTLMMLAAMPFMTAILGYIFLKEKVSLTTLIAIIVAAVGIKIDFRIVNFHFFLVFFLLQ